jgi:hypothetical protein
MKAAFKKDSESPLQQHEPWYTRPVPLAQKHTGPAEQKLLVD